MCLPTCPTYDATLHERHSPRGRIALMRAVAEDELYLGNEFAKEMSYCLGCLACQTACPAGVDYGDLFETSRVAIEEAGIQSGTARGFWRWLTLRQLFMKPRLLRAAGRVLRFYQTSGLETLARHLRLMRFLPGELRRLEPQTPRISAAFSHQLIGEQERPIEAPKHRVALLTGCVQDLAFSDINRDTVDVLLANGCAVDTPAVQSCCGSLHGHNGERELSRKLARRQLDQIPPERYDAIITNAGGCGSHLRHYGRLLDDDTDYRERASDWDLKLRDIHEWLAEIDFRPPEAPPFEHPVRLAYHESCHLSHGQKVTKQPRDLLRSIPGVEWCELVESSWCCGSAGVYNITQPAQSQELLERKVGHIRATGADIVATANPGCHLQVARGLEDTGLEVKVIHPVSVLALAYRNEKL